MDELNTIGYILQALCAIILIVDVWRSPTSGGMKVLWTILAILFGLIALAVWLLFGRKRAYAHTRTGSAY